MSQYTDKAWEASNSLTKWDGQAPNFENETLRYKLFETPKAVWYVPDTDEVDAHWLIGIDSGGVRMIDIVLDTAYGINVADPYQFGLHAC